MKFFSLVFILSVFLFGSGSVKVGEKFQTSDQCKACHLDIVNDQFGRPTYAGHLAESCIAALEHMPSSPKIYHVSNSGPIISWADFAATIFEHAKIQPEINRVSSKQFSSPTQRPANSALDISGFEMDFRHPLEPWDAGLKLAFHEMRI